MPSLSARHAPTAAHRAQFAQYERHTLSTQHSQGTSYRTRTFVFVLSSNELKFPTDNHQRIGLIAQHRFAQTKWTFDFHHPYSTTVT